MKAIACVDRQWGIGSFNNLLFKIKEDMKFFKSMTMGKVVVMGMNTYKSMGSKPLKDRVNLVISNSVKERSDDNNLVIGNMDEINEEIKKYNTDNVFIIGGGSIYAQFLKKCDEVYVTHVEDIVYSDVYMPDLGFEGFKAVEIIDKGRSNIGTNSYDADWRIMRWVPYHEVFHKSTLSFFFPDNSKHKSLKIYTDDLTNWEESLTNNEVSIDPKIVDAIKFMIEHDLKDKEIMYTKFNDNLYKAEYNHVFENPRGIRPIFGRLRIAGYGTTVYEAHENLYSAMMRL